MQVSHTWEEFLSFCIGIMWKCSGKKKVVWNWFLNRLLEIIRLWWHPTVYSFSFQSCVMSGLMVMWMCLVCWFLRRVLPVKHALIGELKVICTNTTESWVACLVSLPPTCIRNWWPMFVMSTSQPAIGWIRQILIFTEKLSQKKCSSLMKIMYREGP